MMPADVNLNIDIEKKGSGDKEAAAGLELVAHAADSAKDELAALDRKLVETRLAMVSAGKSFAQTGDISPFKALLKDERQLSQVSKTLKRLTEDVGKSSGPSFAQGLLNSISGTAPTGIGQWLAGGIVLAGPAIGAALSGAVLTAAGGATLAGGIALVASSPVVRGAYSDLGKYVHQQLTDAATGLEEPVAHSAQVLRAAFNEVLPSIHGNFQAMEPVVDHLAAGIANMAINMSPGFSRAVQASVPLLNQIADDSLPRMGSAISYFFSSVAQGAPGAEAFFHDMTTALDLSVKQLGSVTLAMSKLYELARAGGQGDTIFDKMSHAAASATLTGPLNGILALLDHLDGKAKTTKLSLDPMAEALSHVGNEAKNAGLGAKLGADDFSALQSAINATRTTTDALAGQMAVKLLNTTLSLDQATLGFAQAQTSLSEAIKANGRELDIHTAKGEANRAAVLSTVAANIQAYQTNIQAGIGAEDAARAYDANTGALEKQLRQAGLTTGQIDGLIGKYRAVPDKVDTQIAVEGLSKAIGDLDETLRLINNLPSHRSVYVDVITSQVGGPVGAVSGGRVTRAQAFGGITLFGAQGLIASAPSIIVGERTVPEAAIPAPNSGISQARADMLLGTAASWWGRRLVPAGGGGGTVINLTVNAGMGADGRQVGDQVLEVLRRAIKSRGGNVQMILAGKAAQ